MMTQNVFLLQCWQLHSIALTYPKSAAFKPADSSTMRKNDNQDNTRTPNGVIYLLQNKPIQILVYFFPIVKHYLLSLFSLSRKNHFYWHDIESERITKSLSHSTSYIVQKCVGSQVLDSHCTTNKIKSEECCHTDKATSLWCDLKVQKEIRFLW